jgi:hypothetical protein
VDGAMRELIAKQAITEQIHTYCRAVDRIDNDLGRSVWHEDGTADYGPIFQGTGHGFIEYVEGSHRAKLGHSHQITNILIRVDGDRAASEAYVTATLRFEQDGVLRQATIQGRYLDRWSRRAGRWAIDHRHFVHDLDAVQDVVATRFTSWGRRDRDDPSYALFASGD